MDKIFDQQPLNIDVSSAERTAWAMNNVLVPAYNVTMSCDIDARQIENLRRNFLEKYGRAPSVTAIVVKVVSHLLEKHPESNRAILGLPFFKKLYQFTNVDISIAVEKNLPALPGMPFASVLRNPLLKNVFEISSELKALVECTEDSNYELRNFMRILNWLPTPVSLFLINIPYVVPRLWVKYRGCAAWVNSPSKAGVDSVFTSWPWPMTFSFGLLKTRPFVIEDQVKAIPTLPLIFVFDRRIMGGGPASRLFAEFCKDMQNLEALFEFSDLEKK